MSRFVYWLKIHKVKLISSVLIVVALAILYYLFSPPVLWLTSNQSKVNLEMNGQSKGILSRTRIMFLKPGIYTLRASKDGFLEYNDLVIIGKSKITKRNIFLNEMYYVSATPSRNILNASFLNYSADGQKLILFADKSFYEVPLDQKGYIVADYKAQKIDLDLDLADDESVVNVKYSSDKKQALLIIIKGDDREIKIANFETEKVSENQSFYDADWLGSGSIIGIDKNDRQKIIQWDLTGQPQEIITLSANSIAIYAGLDGKSVLTTSDEAVNIINLETKSPKEIKLSSEFITSAQAIPNGQFVVLTTKKTYLVNTDGQKKEMDINPYFGDLAIQDDSNLLFITFNSGKKTYDFTTFSLKTKKTKIINSLSQDLGDPTDLIIAKDYVNYIVNGNIMGFKIK